MITRRDLFIKTMQLSAAGTLITSLPGKLIAQTLEIATDDYDIALDLAKQVLNETKLFGAAKTDNVIRSKWPPLAVFHADRVCEIGETLIGFMCDRFPPTLSADEVRSVKAMFGPDRDRNKDARKLMWEREPRVVFGAIFTIAVVSELVIKRAPFSTQKMPSFVRFSEMYRDLILVV